MEIKAQLRRAFNNLILIRYRNQWKRRYILENVGIDQGETIVTIHCGSRGLGHQIGTEYLKRMVMAAAEYGLTLVDRELACAPIDSNLGRSYLGAMRGGINCALANRQIITHLFADILAGTRTSESLSLASACHGAGRRMSRRQALKSWRGR